MDDDTGERGDQPSELATASLHEDSSGLNDRSDAVLQQNLASGDGVVQQHHTSLSDAANPLHSDPSRFNDQSNAVTQQIVSSIGSIVQQHHTSPSNSAAVTQLAHPGGSSLSFLDLPPEIRNMIYCCVFPEGQSAVQLLARHSGKSYIAMSDRLHLLYTCRQIYDEATSWLQAAQRFKVVKPRSLLALIGNCWYDDDHDDYGCDCGCGFCGGENGIIQRILPEDGLFFEYDMDRGTVKKNMPALFYVNQSFQYLCAKSASNVRYIAETSTSTRGPVSDSFGALQHWLRKGLTSLFTLREEIPGIVIAVKLHFRMSEITTLEDIRFELNSLSDAIVRRSPILDRLTADLVVRIENPGGSVSSKSKLIVDVLMDSLIFLRQVRTDHPELRDEPCPKILIDGQFRVREAQFCLKNGNKLELTNEERFWDFGESDSPWGDMDFQGKWEDMISEGLTSGLEPPEPNELWPSLKSETINNETLEGSTVELAKRVINCFH